MNSDMLQNNYHIKTLLAKFDIKLLNHHFQPL